jgi:hypothetical protein
MLPCEKVLANNKSSLFLDYFPIINQKLEKIQREFLGLKVLTKETKLKKHITNLH